jgi:hypothetical protein
VNEILSHYPALSGRIAVITGASGAIGGAVCLALARYGASIVASRRNKGALERMLADVRNEGGNAITITADVTGLDDLEKLHGGTGYCCHHSPMISAARHSWIIDAVRNCGAFPSGKPRVDDCHARWKSDRQLFGPHTEQIFIRDGNVWTPAGISVGIDLVLALKDDDLGADAARRAAPLPVVHTRRLGGQSQFSDLSNWEIGQDPSASLSIGFESIFQLRRGLAEHVTMSPRNFARAFTVDIGVTPAKAVERIRLEIARGAIKVGHSVLDIIARQAGFDDLGHMHGAFVRTFGQPPQALDTTIKGFSKCYVN